VGGQSERELVEYFSDVRHSDRSEVLADADVQIGQVKDAHEKNAQEHPAPKPLAF
jgi:hypothetical protein